MPELKFSNVPEVIEENRKIHAEVMQLVQYYFKNYHHKGWPIFEGVKKWIDEHHFLIQAPIEDQSLGGCIFFRGNKKICYLNTWQSRIYQNFVILHELYHILSSSIHEPLHLIERDWDSDRDERKADYFASLLLFDDNELFHFYKSIEDQPITSRFFHAMSRFSAPYKATLIRLFEMELIDSVTLQTYFDKTYDWEVEFEKIGLDPYMVQPSHVINFNRIEKQMSTYRLPEIAHEENAQLLQSIKGYFLDRKKT